MDKFLLNITNTITEEKLQEGLFIFMFRATRIPPHLGVITNGKLYDISTVGPNIDLPVLDFYKTVLKRKTEVVFIELNRLNKTTDEVLNITEKVKEYWKVDGETSCLSQIKDFISEVYKIDVSSAQFMFDLYPILKEFNLIKEVSQVNLDKKVVDNLLELSKYTHKDIENCIAALQRKQTVTC